VCPITFRQAQPQPVDPLAQMNLALAIPLRILRIHFRTAPILLEQLKQVPVVKLIQ